MNETRPRTPWLRWALMLTSLALALSLGGPNVARAAGESIIFLHHSCGENLINEGGVREGLTAHGYEFYDHGYNGEMRLADGSDGAGSEYDFEVPGDNTDPDGLAAIFAQPLHDPPDNAFSHLMQHDVIIFKSCFPNSNIGDDAQLAEFQSYYLSIRDRTDQHPEKLFIFVTQPPQVPGASDSAEAERARALADWLGSDEFLSGHPNITTFDFFGHLAGNDNFLRPEYRYDDYDAHPNERANQTIGPIFVEFIDQAIRSFEAGEPIEPVAPAEPGEPAAPEEAAPEEAAPEEAGPAPVAGVIDDFEGTTEAWHADTGDEDSVVECGSDTTWAHDGTQSLRIHYTIAPGGWTDCAHPFDALQDWSNGTGVSLWVRTDNPGKWVTWMLFSGDPDNPTPFELSFQTTPESESEWVQFSFAWGEFSKAEWADAGGLSEVDPTRITGYGFSIGEDETSNEGIIWVDEITLMGVESAPAPAPAEPAEEGAEEAEELPAPQPEAGPARGLCPGAAVTMVLAVGAMPLGWAASRRKRG
jgi:hypothetical protein